MGSKILLFIISFLFTSSTAEVQQKDVIDVLSVYFKESNSKDFAGHFSSLIEMSIMSEENEYSKAQAELILRDFFLKNKPASVKVIHRLSSSANYRFAVLSFQTTNDNYRISISLALEGDRFLIKVIRIEYDKE